MTRGRPFQPGNRFGKGRPKGSRNKRSVHAQELLDELRVPLLRKAGMLALEGDGPALRSLLSYVLTKSDAQPCNIGKLPLETIEDLDRSSKMVLNKATTNQITLEHAEKLIAMIGVRRQVLETSNIHVRLKALESVIPEERSGALSDGSSSLRCRKR